MSDARPADISLHAQDREPDRTPTSEMGDLDEQGEGLDEHGLAPEPSPANPLSPGASMSAPDSE